MEKKAVIESHALPASQISLGGVLRIPAVHQVLLLVGVAAAVAAGFAVVLWSQTPAYTKLYSDLDNANAAQVAESLRAAGIDFKLDTESGVVLVAESRLHDARLELASQGLPQGSAGMDMIQEQSSFGVSQFMEGARYQHALEAELARTISHLGAVSDARVHLAMPKQSAFMREQKGASASVLLQLYRGRELEPDQASSIVHLVASSIPNLTAGNVTLIDQNGRLLSSAGDQMPGAQA
ncbi:MAG: flagellar basal-body MS-ring/collar protein FliF, partial [Gammaproteobacteria bacterium]|nr:flagellar basal-body MS-ring/collar protein FliF [Gammaproteobacteria bacterium]